MKKHTKIYLDYFGYQIPEDVFCEICGSPAKDIHHIESRGMGGSKEADKIENLMAVCRCCHENYGDVSDLKETLTKVHLKYMEINGKANTAA